MEGSAASAISMGSDGLHETELPTIIICDWRMISLRRINPEFMSAMVKRHRGMSALRPLYPGK
jgi:hypothetical protein